MGFVTEAHGHTDNIRHTGGALRTFRTCCRHLRPCTDTRDFTQGADTESSTWTTSDLYIGSSTDNIGHIGHTDTRSTSNTQKSNMFTSDTQTCDMTHRRSQTHHDTQTRQTTQTHRHTDTSFSHSAHSITQTQGMTHRHTRFYRHRDTETQTQTRQCTYLGQTQDAQGTFTDTHT